MEHLETFTQACIESLYFTDTGEEGQPDQDARLSPQTLEDLKADCRSFWRRFGCYILSETCVDVFDGIEARAAAMAGHDFWLTRNGHGAGFWDGDWPSVYETMLTSGAENYGSFETYEGDDGLIYA